MKHPFQPVGWARKLAGEIQADLRLDSSESARLATLGRPSRVTFPYFTPCKSFCAMCLRLSWSPLSANLFENDVHVHGRAFVDLAHVTCLQPQSCYISNSNLLA
jgi:hypothetical protein